MKPNDFPASKSSFLKVHPHGFILKGHSFHAFDALILNASLARKRFIDKKLVCYSPDGAFSKKGLRCSDCSDLNACLPRVRLLLQPKDPSLGSHLLIELPFSSARNFFDLEAHLENARLPIYLTPLRLAVVPRGSWGEVIFSILPNLNSPPKQPENPCPNSTPSPLP